MTLWYLSILTNVFAISISTLFSIIYTKWRLKTNKPNKKVLKWYDYIMILVFVMLSGFIAYGIIYLLSGYVPMSQISSGLLARRVR
tara:strand:+ start:24 stop:281 length:258 start_codon:yes stop_codon:yes gene_type:complete